MKPFIFIEHSADIKFEAYGKSLEEVFAHCIQAVGAIYTEEVIKETKSTSIEVRAETKEKMLFDLIDEIIFIIEDQEFLPAKVTSITIKDNILSATIAGDNIAHYQIETAVKAMTYHEMVIEENEHGYVVQVVVDI